MKSEIITIRELRDDIDNHYQSAVKIVDAYDPEQSDHINVQFFTRQRDYFEPFVKKYQTLYTELMAESLEDRVFRALGDTKDVCKIDKVIQAVQLYRQEIIDKRMDKIEEVIKLIDEELKAHEKYEAQKRKKESEKVRRYKGF